MLIVTSCITHVRSVPLDGLMSSVRDDTMSLGAAHLRCLYGLRGLFGAAGIDLYGASFQFSRSKKGEGELLPPEKKPDGHVVVSYR